MEAKQVSNLTRQAARLLAALRATKKHVFNIEHNQPSDCLTNAQDAAFMRQKLTLLERLLQGEQAVQEGRVHTQAEAREKMAAWLK